MITRISPKDLPGAGENKLYLDYVGGEASALQFYTHAPADFYGGLSGRSAYPFPRAEVAPLLRAYNLRLGAHERALANVDALEDGSAFCVVTGQQAGFMGGPAYAVYKIITAIRLAENLENTLNVRVVPVFWLATEDHDLGEIDHVYHAKPDGEIGRIRFRWQGAGRPIADLPVTADVQRAFAAYVVALSREPYGAVVAERFAPQDDEGFCEWQARTWVDLFSDRGLVMVEPGVLRPAAGDLFSMALARSKEIRQGLEDVARRLTEEGYAPALTSVQAGTVYTFGEDGVRVRVDDPAAHEQAALSHPERYSTDAALRPLFADALLPVLVSVLGPGEIAYQGMLRPLYDLYGVPQPVLFPRKSYTVVSSREAERIAAYGLEVGALLREDLDLDAAFQNTVPASDLALFDSSRGDVEAALLPLRAYLVGIDPSLGRTWEQTLSNATRALDKLQQRALKARMSQLGLSKGELRSLSNALYPRGRLQERTLPLPHFIGRHGMAFLDRLSAAGELDDFSHHLVVLEEDGA